MTEVSARIPASTSNLGSGFDCIGFAVDLWLRASVVVGGAQSGVSIRRAGTLAGLELAPEQDLLHTGFAAACRSAGREVPGRLEYTVTSAIPVARGLGSSAAAFVAGAALASRALGLGLRPVALAELCAAHEGHPDNAGPAALGGAVLGVRAPASTGRHYLYSRLRVDPGLSFVFAIPDFEVRTADARAVLPRQLAYGDAVQAAAKSAALVRGLATGNGDLLAVALDDVLHTPYRRHLIPGFEAVTAAASRAGAFGTTLSGSGSTLLAIAPRALADAVARAMRGAWECEVRVVERPAVRPRSSNRL